MRLESDVFQIDAAAYVERLCGFVRERQSALHREGILVPLSGGLDSSTVLLLCARAAGRENVTALIMPEKQGNPESSAYCRILTKELRIRTIRRDISSVLARLGTYKFILSAIPSRAAQDWAAKRYMRSATENPFLHLASGDASGLERKGFAAYNSKHRMRLVLEYLVAEEGNFLVAGCAHKSEDMVGLFVKFGVDDNADIMPLKNLYRSQIVQLAEFLGVPQPILNRSPNPDIIPGVNDKYLDILGLPCDRLDLVLYGIEHDMDSGAIAEQLGLSEAKVSQIRSLVQQTQHMRNPSQTLTWE